MTRKQVEKITGLTLWIDDSITSECIYALQDDQGRAVVSRVGHKKDERKILKALVEDNYSRVRFLVARKQNFRCAECGRLGPLEADHIKPRSKGRDDRIENLRMVCSGTGCGAHRRKHGG